MGNKYLELHPISEKPEKDGWYYAVNPHGLSGGILPNMLYYSQTNGWGEILVNATHYLRPVTGVLVSEEELREVLESSYLSGFMQEDKDQTVDNLTNKLSNQ